MTAEIIRFELRPTIGRYELVEISRGIDAELYVALAGPRGTNGRDPWHCLAIYRQGRAEAECARDEAFSASERHGGLPIMDLAGVIDPSGKPGRFDPRAPSDG